MKRIYFFLLLSLFTVTGFSQAVTADLFLSDNHFEDLSGNLIDANKISYNQAVKIKVTIHNGNAPGGDAAPAGHFRLRIGLGSGMVLNPGFNLTTAPLSSYFSWHLDMSGAQPQIVGNSIAALPADFAGVAAFELKGVTAGTSNISYNLLIANPVGTTTPFSDPVDGNNIASNEYTVASPLTFTTSTLNVSCFGSSDGKITITPSGGVPGYTYTIVNATTSVSTSNNTGVFTGLAPALYNITVTDDAGITSTGSTTITEPLQVTVAATSTNVSCFGLADGTISVSGLSTGTTYTIKKDGTGADLSAQTVFGPGTYHVVASAPDGNNVGVCTKEVIVIVNEPAQVTVSAAFTNVSCNGLANGTITVTTNGAGYTIKKDGTGADLSAQSNFGPGTYVITASSPNGNNNGVCTATTSVTITEPAAVTLSVTSTNVSCFGAANGTITATASTGAVVTVNGNPYNPSASYGPGSYTVIATASGGNAGQTCTKQETIVITEPIAVTVSAVTTNVSCYGAADGTITVTVSTGASYTIQKDGVGADLSGQTAFAPGTYLITASAPNGNNNGTCTKTTSVTIIEPAVVTVSATHTNVSCFGAADGTITVTASTGAVVTVNGNPYNPSALYGPGTYTIVASSPNGNNNGFCSQTTSVTITEPTNVVLTVNYTNVNCHGAADATITATASGATITVNGNPYNSSATYGPGSYTIVATAPGGNSGQTCTKTQVITITQPDAVTVTASRTNVTCNGAANGTITVTGLSTGATYIIQKDGTGADLSAQTNFAPGTYVITASAASGNGTGVCTNQTSVTITEPPVLTNLFISKVNNACNGGSEGQIKVAASGGTPAYTYSIVSGPTVNTTGASTGVFTGLAAGTYTIQATDANGCIAAVNNIIVTQPAGTNPDVILSVADYTDNFFPANATEVTLIYQLTEIGGNPALNNLVRITKQAGYTFSLPAVSTVTVGAGANAITYAVDNNRWTANNTNAVFFTVGINSGQQIGCGQSVYLAIKLTRATPNKSVFALTSVLQGVTGEVVTSNNATTVVLVGQ